METKIHIGQLMKYLRVHFRLDWRGIHGAGHWARVLYNGSKIAESDPEVRLDVVKLFALLHDHERHDDYSDPLHGIRATLNAEKLRGKYFEIDDDGFEMLSVAMDGHSNIRFHENKTIQACWDADRMDLGRVGIVPDPNYLGSALAKDPEILKLAYERSLKHGRN